MWLTSPENIVLSPSEIHVWRANLDINLSLQKKFWTTLSDDEKRRAERFRFSHLRVHYIASRGILRQLLSRYLSVSTQSLRFEYGEQGKPSLADFPHFQFNISHSENQLVLAFAQEITLGIDVEFINPKTDFEVIAPNFFSKNEADTLLAQVPEDRPQVFFNCWTRKEAFIKAKGGGLSIPLDKFEVTLLSNDTPRLLAIDWAPEEVENWSTFSFKTGEGFVGALMTDGEVKEVCFFDFE